MIPRTLVPVNVRPIKNGEPLKLGHRTTTYMDDRTVVPSGMSDAPPLDGKTTIPAHLPLGVLVDRTLVARGMPATPFEKFAPTADTIPLAILNSRIVVPAYVEPAAPENRAEFRHTPELTEELREVIEPDIFITGDANLLIESEEKRDTKWDLITRTLSVLVHVGLIVFLVFTPKIFPTHVPSQQETDLARRELTYLLPPEEPTPRVAPRPAPKLRIDPKTLNRIAPPVEQPQPAPTPLPQPAPKPPVELPEAPRPQAPSTPAPQTQQPAPSQLEPIRPQPNSRLNLQLPQASPGQAIQDQLHDAIERNTGGGLQVPGGDVPRGPGGGPGMGQGYQILTDTQGVDFSSYIQRLLASLKRNWYYVMPQSAIMGDRGMVYTTFQINRDGSVPAPDPILERTSGKEPLDVAAMSAIHTSNPFEPLPAEFKGPYIRLRIVFLYNVPPDQLK